MNHVVHSPRPFSLLVNRERVRVPVAEFGGETATQRLRTVDGRECTELLVRVVPPPRGQPTLFLGTRPSAINPPLREEVKQFDLVALPLVSCDSFHSSPTAFKSALVDKAETRSFLSDRCLFQHLVNTRIRVVSIDAERVVSSSEVSQPPRLFGIAVADSIVPNGWIAFRPSPENSANGPVLRVACALRAGEQIQVDTVLGNHQEVMDVLVDQARLINGPEGRANLNWRLPRTYLRRYRPQINE